MQTTKTPDELRRLPIERTLSAGKHSVVVLLRQGGVVEKQVGTAYRRDFDREVAILKRLVGCPFTPQLLAVDTDSDPLSVFMTYCGEPIGGTKFDPDTKRRVAVLTKELRKRWSVRRNMFTSRLPRPHNVVKNDGRLYLIDFGGSWNLQHMRTPKQR